MRVSEKGRIASCVCMGMSIIFSGKGRIAVCVCLPSLRRVG